MRGEITFALSRLFTFSFPEPFGFLSPGGLVRAETPRGLKDSNGSRAQNDSLPSLLLGF